MTERIIAIVPRSGFGLKSGICAVISADKNVEIYDADSLRKEITAAVTEWMRDTSSGRASFGDFASDYEDADLKSGLEARGVVNLEIIAQDAAENWTYDTKLTEFVEDDD